MINFNRKALTKSRAFLFLCLCFIAGIGLASFLPTGIINLTFLWFGGAILFFLPAVIFWEIESIRFPGLVIFIFLLAIWRYAVSLPGDSPDKIWHYNNSKAAVVGMVATEPDERTKNTRLTVEAETAGGRQVSGRILVVANPYPKYQYGDKLEMECKLQKPSSENFSYDRYLARYDIYSICYNPKIKLLGQGQGNIFYAYIFRLKERIRGIISVGLPEPEAGLAKGFVLGDLKAIDDELSDVFSKSGLSHIVAISGANISIVAGVVMNVLFWLSLNRKRAFYIASIFLVAYIIMVGAPASAMRAGLMGFLVLWALYLGRLNKMANALALAAGLMLAFNPKLLRDDVGFQLSFLAIIGVSYIYPSIDKFLENINMPNWLSVREAIGMTVAAQILTLPVMVYDFGRISIVAIPANVLASWTLAPLMVILPISVATSALVLKWSWLVFSIPWLLLKYLVSVAGWCSALPHASLEYYLSGAGVIIMLVYYLFWIVFIYRVANKRLTA